jgi:hypothetical protein
MNELPIEKAYEIWSQHTKEMLSHASVDRDRISFKRSRPARSLELSQPTKLKFRAHHILSQAIEQGIRCGLMHATKHSTLVLSDQMMEQMVECVERDIWIALDDVVQLGDEND